MKQSLRLLVMVRDVRPLHITTKVYNGISGLLFMVLLACGIWQWLESLVFAPLNGTYIKLLIIMYIIIIISHDIV